MWARENALPLAAVYEMVGSVFDDTDFSLAVWLFFDTDSNVAQFDADGTTACTQDAFSKILRDGGYPDEWLAVVTFHVDSHERVEREFCISA